MTQRPRKKRHARPLLTAASGLAIAFLGGCGGDNPHPPGVTVMQGDMGNNEHPPGVAVMQGDLGPTGGGGLVPLDAGSDASDGDLGHPPGLYPMTDGGT